jgi:multicomponent K+:H+ antiporter subunit D
VLLLLVASLLLTVFAEPVVRYTTATAASLNAPRAYIDAVLETPPVPDPVVRATSAEAR